MNAQSQQDTSILVTAIDVAARTRRAHDSGESTREKTEREALRSWGIGFKAKLQAFKIIQRLLLFIQAKKDPMITIIYPEHKIKCLDEDDPLLESPEQLPHASQRTAAFVGAYFRHLRGCSIGMEPLVWSRTEVTLQIDRDIASLPTGDAWVQIILAKAQAKGGRRGVKMVEQLRRQMSEAAMGREHWTSLESCRLDSFKTLDEEALSRAERSYQPRDQAAAFVARYFLVRGFQVDFTEEEEDTTVEVSWDS